MSFWTRVADIASRYAGSPVIILGKGASADDVDPRVLDRAFVIGINDSERVGHVNVTIFREPWVWDQITGGGCRSELYLTSADIPIEDERVFRAEFEALTQENSELMYQRIFTDSLVVEEVMLLTAVRIGLHAAESCRALEIYLVGFEFSTEHGFSRKVDATASGHSASTQKHRIEMQEQVFLATGRLLEQRHIRLVHVGYRPFSSLTPGAFSERILHLGTGQQPPAPMRGGLLITAEVTTNHLGDVERAKTMMRMAKAQGADLVKFQMRDVESFYRAEVLDGPYPSPFGETFRDYRLGLELDDDEFREIDAYAREIGVGWFASVLDLPSLERAIGLQMPLIKLPGTISRRRDFLAEVARCYEGDLVFSTGMTSPEYVDWLLETFGTERRIFLLHANSAYPTPIEDCNVSVVSTYARLAENHPHIIPGYSSHDEGWFGSALAVACGARMVEKHVKLGSNEWLHFDSVALDLEGGDFGDFVSALRKAEVAAGQPDKRVTPSEHHKY